MLLSLKALQLVFGCAQGTIILCEASHFATNLDSGKVLWPERFVFSE